jgi:glycosyltransferase involved in cell wall biosynthesis
VLMISPLHIEQAAKLIDVDHAHFFPNTCVPPATLPTARDRASDGVCQVVYVGRLSRLKGTYDLIAAIARLLRSSDDFRFVLIGVGATPQDDERVTRLIAEQQLGDHVVLAGPMFGEEKWRTLAESQIMVFPSLAELFPVTLVEGLAAGLPIVTTSVDYLPRLIVHGENGLIVPPSAPNDLAEALLVLGGNAETRQRMSRANRLKFEREFALDVVAGQLRRIYESVLDRAPAAKV